jgi:hypothetical protein
MRIAIILSLLFSIISLDSTAQKKREIIPRDSITNKYCYQAVSDLTMSTKDELRTRLERWIKENYNEQDSKYTKVLREGDTFRIHDREALPGKARKFVEYDLTIDLKDNQYRYKLTDLQYAAVGMYPLEDKMATDKKSDFEEMNVILTGIIKSMEAALKDPW